MIDTAINEALERISARAQDVLHAYQGGFEPHAQDVAIGAQARTEPSADPLSVVAPEGAYFVVADASGARRYSRDGAFTLNDGTLRGQDGSVILGGTAPQGALQPLRVDRVDRALGHVVGERIEADGSVWYTRTVLDPRTGQARVDRVNVGRIALARFPAGTLPLRVDPTHVVAPSGVTPHIGMPADGNFPMLATGRRDLGRLDILGGLSRLQEAYLSFEALRATHTVHEGTEKTAMELLK
jgi:hypothetical protein